MALNFEPSKHLVQISPFLQAIEEEQIDNSSDIKRCEEFKKKTYDTFKTMMYNEGKNIKSKN
jgi:hypothetical protein